MDYKQWERVFGLNNDWCYSYNNCDPVIVKIKGYKKITLHKCWSDEDGSGKYNNLVLCLPRYKYSECGRSVWGEDYLRISAINYEGLNDEELVKKVIEDIEKQFPSILERI